MFEIEPGLMIWTILSFLILVGILAKVAYNPLLKVINDREDMIKKAIDDSNKAKTDAENLLKEHKKKLDEVRVEVAKMISEGKEAGETIKTGIVQKAKEESEQIIKKAREEVSREKDKAMSDLQAEIADFSVKIASKVISKNLKKEDHMALLNECIIDMKGI